MFEERPRLALSRKKDVNAKKAGKPSVRKKKKLDKDLSEGRRLSCLREDSSERRVGKGKQRLSPKEKKGGTVLDPRQEKSTRSSEDEKEEDALPL